MAVPGTLSGELQGKLGLEASENSIFQKLTSKIGLNSNFVTFTKKSKIWNCHKNWLVIGMKLKFPGNAYLIDSNKWWKFQRNWRTFIAMTALARTVIDWNDPAISKDWNTLPYCKCDSNSEWYAVFSIWKFGLIPSLLDLSIARVTLVFICTTCLFQSISSSIDFKIFNRMSWYKSFTIQFELEAVIYFQFSWSWDNKFCFLHIETCSCSYLFALNNQFERFDKCLLVLIIYRAMGWII